MSDFDWNSWSTNTEYFREHEARAEQREAHARIIERHAPPYDPLRDNAAHLREIVGLVLEHFVYAEPDEDGWLHYPPMVVPNELALRLKNAHRMSMGEVGR